MLWKRLLCSCAARSQARRSIAFRRFNAPTTQLCTDVITNCMDSTFPIGTPGCMTVAPPSPPPSVTTQQWVCLGTLLVPKFCLHSHQSQPLITGCACGVVRVLCLLVCSPLSAGECQSSLISCSRKSSFPFLRLVVRHFV